MGDEAWLDEDAFPYQLTIVSIKVKMMHAWFYITRQNDRNSMQDFPSLTFIFIEIIASTICCESLI